MSSIRFFCNRYLIGTLAAPTRQWEMISVRRRATGAYVSPTKLAKQFEKQFTKMTGHKHGLTFSVPTCGVHKPMDVTLMIKKKRARIFVDNQRNISLAATIFPYVRDSVYSGELGDEFADLKINLTRMEVAHNYSALRIFWYGASGELDVEEKMKETLGRLGVELRDLLSKTSVLSTVPPVVFVLDKIEQERQRMEDILASIDFGPDYVRAETNPSPRVEPKPDDEEGEESISSKKPLAPHLLYKKLKKKSLQDDLSKN